MTRTSDVARRVVTMQQAPFDVPSEDEVLGSIGWRVNDVEGR